MKNTRNKLSLLLVVAMLVLNTSMASFAGSNLNSKDFLFYETNNGFVMQYEEIEDGKLYFYDEKVINDVVHTQRYLKNNDNMILVEELQTKFEQKSNGDLFATVENKTKSTLKSFIVATEEIQPIAKTPSYMVMAASKEWHPTDSDYYKVLRSTGHKGLANLTKAAVLFALGTVITGGNLVSGAIAGIATAVVNGGWSNLYYESTTYYPYGSGAGRPLWKKTVKYFYDRERTNQCGDTLYYDSEILTKI